MSISDFATRPFFKSVDEDLDKSLTQDTRFRFIDMPERTKFNVVVSYNGDKGGINTLPLTEYIDWEEVEAPAIDHVVSVINHAMSLGRKAAAVYNQLLRDALNEFPDATKIWVPELSPKNLTFQHATFDNPRPEPSGHLVKEAVIFRLWFGAARCSLDDYAKKLIERAKAIYPEAVL